MNPIRAFVGHSFNPLDEQVVKSYLSYLDGVKQALPGFSWMHAERPEPKNVTEKVLELLSDKNLLIAICTKKEMVIRPVELRTPLFSRASYLVPKKDVEWKTSDWVIQEIGLAIGRGLKIVILLEDGVRLPGELQGNLERIGFNRDAPEKSFEKLLSMLSSLSPQISPVGEPMISETAPSTEASFDTAHQSDLDGKYEAPNGQWDSRKYEWELLRALWKNDDARHAAIDSAYRDAALYTDGDNKEVWEGYTKFIGLQHGSDSDIETLKKLAESNPRVHRLQNFVALVLEKYDEHDESAIWIRRAASASENPEQKLGYLKSLVQTLSKSGHFSAAKSILSEMAGIRRESGVGDIQLLKGAIVLSEKERQNDLYIAAHERLLELNPADIDSRFSLAYKYSEIGRSDLALLHYSRIPIAERSSTVWNNMGVAFDRIGLPSKAVEAFRKSESLGDTLAMSNIANKQIEAGFLAEATQTCEAAIKSPDHHKNADASFSRLKGVPEEELTKESTSLENAREISSIYRSVGLAATSVPMVPQAQWVGPHCELLLEMEADDFKLVGSYQRDMNFLGFMRDPSLPKNVRTYTVTYTGTRLGCALFGEVKYKHDEEKSSTILRSLGDEPTKVVLWMEEGSQLFSVVEIDSNSKKNEYKLLPKV